MENDDRPRGRVLSRREALKLLASTSVCALTGYSSRSGSATHPETSGCVVRPALTEGPYFVDGMLDRSDIRSDPSNGSVTPGVPLRLTINVARLSPGVCTPLAGARVDIWHCDALGAYSDVSDPYFNTAGKKFLRGYQVTDTDGRAVFTTIYPGWYPGRAVHIHFKVRSNVGARPGYEFTSQWFFDDALTDQVYAQQPYAARGRRTIYNNRDGIYRQGGSQLVLALAPANQGYAATFDIALQTTG
jgi:protocatechuate 3,4-dioxygenase beta subunit